MINERKVELYNELLGYICELINDEKELVRTLVRLGFTEEELMKEGLIEEGVENMKRRYIINGWQESRDYFLQCLGRFTEEEYNTLINGGKVYREDNVFTIENINGL